jgi:hypothetical protein
MAAVEEMMKVAIVRGLCDCSPGEMLSVEGGTRHDVLTPIVPIPIPFIPGESYPVWFYGGAA